MEQKAGSTNLYRTLSVSASFPSSPRLFTGVDFRFFQSLAAEKMPAFSQVSGPSMGLGSSQVIHFRPIRPYPISEEEPEAAVEEEVEKGPAARRERKKWSPTEDVVLCNSWLNISKVAADPRLNAYWKRITDYHNSSPKLVGFEKRVPSHCKHRWHKINGLVSKFKVSYEAAMEQKSSEQNDDNDVMKVAYEIFYNDHNKKFNLEHAWMELRNEQKWLHSLIGKGEGSAKKRKLDDPSESSNTVNESDELRERPKDVKSSKDKGKKSVSKRDTVESTSNSLVEPQTMLTFKEKELDVKERMSKMGLLDILIAKKEPLSEMELALKNKLINDILKS